MFVAPHESGSGPGPTPPVWSRASPLAGAQRPRARQAVEAVLAPAFDPKRSSSFRINKLLNNLIRDGKYLWPNGKAECFGGLRVHNQFKFRRARNREISWLGAP